MAKGHSYLWRKPGRRDEERKRFADLMRKVDAVRLRYGMTKMELPAELGANVRSQAPTLHRLPAYTARNSKV